MNGLVFQAPSWQLAGARATNVVNLMACTLTHPDYADVANFEGMNHRRGLEDFNTTNGKTVDGTLMHSTQRGLATYQGPKFVVEQMLA